MAWLKHPACLRTLWPLTDLWIGQGMDSGQYRYQLTLNGTSRWITATSLGFQLQVEGETLKPILTDCNGWYAFQGPLYTIWYDGSQWVLMDSPAFPGYHPSAWYNYALDQVEGDGWWTSDALPDFFAGVMFQPHGTVTGTKTVTLDLPGLIGSPTSEPPMEIHTTPTPIYLTEAAIWR